MLEVNVLGVARTIEAVLPGMFARGRGTSWASRAWRATEACPGCPGYSASKAALTTYLEGLRPALKRRGVTITTVYPGFVRTAMTAGTPFRKPVPMLEPEQAARYVVRGRRAAAARLRLSPEHGARHGPAPPAAERPLRPDDGPRRARRR